jgi:hypothetical protein
MISPTGAMPRKSTGPRLSAANLRPTRSQARALEDAEDYRAFESASFADYTVRSAVERELVLASPPA